ncbi:hypothetical protein [Hephaestia mangrovi]|uniref:hypothetical protein n=1 Tax=Hephaestia mangrovi TaxID=2873268 RepID=UPI001CA76237|nr:hypothetical protein [Hephaestia mangrovi]MBY8826587.1 hypothetical protein [Hephaestia mangrovi]
MTKFTDLVSTPSRRTMLAGLAVAPVAVTPLALSSDAPSQSTVRLPPLQRSRDGRALSRFRYHNAEGFFAGLEHGGARRTHRRLYQIGIVQQLALSAHLLDVGFDDRWCAHHIGLRVARSLELANATGLDFRSPDETLLATLLTPYSKWRHCEAPPPSFPFSEEDVVALTRSLLDHVRTVTGHPRPRGWRNERHG